MKKTLFFGILSTLVLSSYSCNSDDLPNTSVDELYEVTFNISNFTSEVSEMSTRSTLAESEVKYLRYVILNKAVPINQVVEEKTLEGAAITSPLKLKLRKGNYTIGIFASEKPIVANKIPANPGGLAGTDYIDAIAIENLTNPNQFQGSVDIEVASTDIQKNIELKRPIGKITLAISDLDKAPNNVQTIVPILVLAGNESQYDFTYFAPGYIATNSGASIFRGQSATAMSTNYACINRGRFITIGEDNPFDFYLPQTINIDYQAGPKPFSNARYDLYIQGVTTNKAEYQNIILLENPELLLTEPTFINDPNAMNPNIVFMTCIKRGLVVKPNEQVIIKGQLFRDSQLSVVVNNTWGETANTNF